MPSLELDLLPTSKDADERFDQKAEQEERATKFFPNLWDPKFSQQFASLVRQSIQYGWEEIRKGGKVSTAGKDVIISLVRLKDDYVHLRGDYRYDSYEMAKFLVETDFDLLPPYVGVSSYGSHLLDGHHRWRAYEMAGLDPLVLTIEVENSNGPVPKLICHYDESVRTKTVSDKHTNEEFIKSVQDSKQMTVKELRTIVRKLL